MRKPGATIPGPTIWCLPLSQDLCPAQSKGVVAGLHPEVDEGALLEPARQGYRGDNGGGQPTPPTVPSVWHASAVEVTEWDSPAHRAVQNGRGEEVIVLGNGVGEGG